MARIPPTSRGALLAALRRFNGERRDTHDWLGWEQRRNHRYAIAHAGRLYPVTEIVRLAVGVACRDFTGGPQANGYVERYGLTVVPLPRTERNGGPVPARSHAQASRVRATLRPDPVPKSAVAKLVAALRDPARAEPLMSFPRDPAAAAQPGLYLWWADDEGRTALSDVLGTPLPPIIYGGSAGATQLRSGKRNTATLFTRIFGMHLNSKIRFSTLRWTLAALLHGHLALQRMGILELDKASEQRLTCWMEDHLQVAALAYADRDTLGAVEGAVLSDLDPPLNLKGMPLTPARSRLRRLRAWGT